jgi:hypothetical protein
MIRNSIEARVTELLDRFPAGAILGAWHWENHCDWGAWENIQFALHRCDRKVIGQPSISRVVEDGPSSCVLLHEQIVSTAHPFFAAVRKINTSLSAPRCSFLPYPCRRARSPASLPASRHVSRSGVRMRCAGRKSMDAAQLDDHVRCLRTFRI